MALPKGYTTSSEPDLSYIVNSKIFLDIDKKVWKIGNRELPVIENIPEEELKFLDDVFTLAKKLEAGNIEMTQSEVDKIDDEIRDYFKLCNRIKELDPKIRFAGVINERGRLVAGGMKEGVKPLESQKEDEVLFMELALKAKMRKEFDKQLGLVNFAMSLREKAIVMSFPIGNSDILYVFADPNVYYQKLLEKILSSITR